MWESSSLPSNLDNSSQRSIIYPVNNSSGLDTSILSPRITVDLDAETKLRAWIQVCTSSEFRIIEPNSMASHGAVGDRTFSPRTGMFQIDVNKLLPIKKRNTSFGSNRADLKVRNLPKEPGRDITLQHWAAHFKFARDEISSSLQLPDLKETSVTDIEKQKDLSSNLILCSILWMTTGELTLEKRKRNQPSPFSEGCCSHIQEEMELSLYKWLCWFKSELFPFCFLLIDGRNPCVVQLPWCGRFPAVFSYLEVKDEEAKWRGGEWPRIHSRCLITELDSVIVSNAGLLTDLSISCLQEFMYKCLGGLLMSSRWIALNALLWGKK